MPKSRYEKIGDALDRFQEAHFWIHGLEEHYHHADPFRWHLNSYLKAIKEVPDLVVMALQNEEGFKTWYEPHRVSLSEDPLLRMLAKHRDYVVHRGMLTPESTGILGITEGRGIKLGLTMPVHALEDSDAAMDRFLRGIAKAGDFFGLLNDDEDSLPCVQRTWRLPKLEGEVVDLCAAAWLRTGAMIDDVLHWLGEEPPPLSLECRHSGQQVQFKLFDRDSLRGRLVEIKAAQAGG